MALPKRWRPQHLSHLAGAFAAARIKHNGLLEAISKAAEVRAAQFHPWAMEDLARAFGALTFQADWLPKADVAPPSKREIAN